MKTLVYLILFVGLFACRKEPPENIFAERIQIIKSHSWRLTVWRYDPPIPFYNELYYKRV